MPRDTPFAIISNGENESIVSEHPASPAVQKLKRPTPILFQVEYQGNQHGSVATRGKKGRGLGLTTKSHTNAVPLPVLYQGPFP